jgi:arabinan endo-1,5-alpha-L-arabinosidase
VSTLRSALATLAAALVLGLAGAAPSVADSRTARDADASFPSTYVNPVSADFADTFADPAVIRGKDGYWYSYGTTDPLREGEATRHLLPISRSTDLVRWEYVTDAFTEETVPAWADTARRAALWAPDVRYVDGEYRLYYVVTETGTNPEINDNAIGVATAPTPTGPWTDSGDPVVDPRRQGVDNYLWTFDPHHVVTEDGTEYLFYGSYYGGIWVTELGEDGTEVVGDATRVAIDNKYEGAYVVQRDGWWYMLVSSANCCAGPTTGYSVHVGRSQDITGPYVDRQGVPLNQSRAGGTPVVAPNGNVWVGTGHNAVATDLAGQDWFVYHAIDRNDPYLTGTEGINERPMLVDRLDWIDGWPTVNAGAWASEGPQPGPVTDGRTVTTFDGDGGRSFLQRGDWDHESDPQAGHHLRSEAARQALLLTRAHAPAQVRVEADLRQAAGASGGYGVLAAVPGKNSSADPAQRAGTAIQAVVDPTAGTLALRTVVVGATTSEVTAPLPAGHTATWHNLALEVRDGVATVEYTEARLDDPLAHLTLPLPAGAAVRGRAGAFALGEGVHVDNLSVVEAAHPVTERAAGPTPGAPLDGPSDEFDGTALEAGWTQVRDPDLTLAGGQLAWPVEDTDLTGPRDEAAGTGNDAGLLLQDAPDGDWTIETKLAIDLGVDDIRNYEQGGLVVLVDEDHFVRLSHVAIWNTRQTEFGKEMPYENRLSYGGTIVGPPSDTTWLRITHRTDDTGEHELQASTSTDGTTWVHGGVWTLPAGADLRYGLVSHGDQTGDPDATSTFDYFRVYGG